MIGGPDNPPRVDWRVVAIVSVVLGVALLAVALAIALS